MAKTRDLNDMMLFIAVIDAGSFTLAAERLNMPKANLSRKISRLEQQLGVTLLERTTRTQHITEAGNHYLAHCRRISQEIELAEVSITQSLTEIKGQLRIGVSVGMGHEIIKPVLGQFLRQHSAINLQLSLLNSHVDLIDEGYDLVIRIGELSDSRLVAKRLGKVGRKIFASPEYMKHHGEIKSIEQLSHADFLLMSSIQGSGRILLTSKEKQQELKVKPRVLVDDFLILKQMILEGIGIAIIPDYMCEEEVANNKLVQLMPNWGMTDVDVYALYPKHRLNLPKVKAFVDFIQIVFKQRLLN
ncbi:LysR family transcriptional regulator [Colwellia sp. 75C3]|uniref:LysR family transcriptional regulator n=1 Tax=Colwellia sp. 75C3 TaxID=888425 RepID=UPI001E34E791|nr:LysR family transcriptional regulator [Colwellia sp. 75C3]